MMNCALNNNELHLHRYDTAEQNGFFFYGLRLTTLKTFIQDSCCWSILFFWVGACRRESRLQMKNKQSLGQIFQHV